MNLQSTTFVFYFLYPPGHERAGDVSNFKATRETIAKYNGEVLEGTREELALSLLDSHGRYRRVATGWGELVA